MRRRSPALTRSRTSLMAVSLALAAAGMAFPNAARANQPPAAAPGAPGKAATWAAGDKDGFSTAKNTQSKVWYTLNDGALTEVFFPRIDTPATRDTQLVVSDGATFTDREDRDMVSRVRLMDSRSLIYQQVNTAKSGKYRITKTYVTDPSRSAVLADVRFESLTGRPYTVYVLHDAGLGLNANDDTGRTERGGLVATDGVISSAVLASPGFTKTSSGYADRSDGWTDLQDNRMDWSYSAAQPGNVVQMGRTQLTGLRGAQQLTLSLGFDPQLEAALATARASLGRSFASARSAYSAEWHNYLSSLRPAPSAAKAWRSTYRASVMFLAAHEDKTFRGGFVAAPSRPWAWANELQHLPVYIAVWSRDQYQIATALLAAGDRAAANRALDYLWTEQQRPDGSFPQNSRLDGEPVFGGLQMDEVAFPIVLSHQLGRTGRAEWARVRRSADFLLARGPRTDQERWENIGGYSPATIAAEIAGLVSAADIARRNQETDLATRYLRTADRWQRDLDRWTLTRNGPLAREPYYLRITDNGDANSGAQIQIADGGPLVDQRRVIDPSFLEMVRLGVKSAKDPGILSTLRAIDERLMYRTPNGPFWHRSSFDGYGERRDGTQWEPVPSGSGETIGRGWPLITGERGEYALAARQPAQRYLDTMGRVALASGSQVIAEQVWDHNPPAGRFTPGENTFSATPLAWSHAQFIRLAHSIDSGRPVETPRIVACRYKTTLC
ncbi:glycoside hydrolase family 15 protein [Actinomadura sp. 6N118]|uniref:glycoside hydrolase family 15 protein n=1 Tax=Actinomadura sp. 6N118 TaxID=3375151 RepID=UPI0037B0FBCA